MTKTKKLTKRRNKKGGIRISRVLLLLLPVFALVIGGFALWHLFSESQSPEILQEPVEEIPEPVSESRGSSSFTFAGVGDNLLHEPIDYTGTVDSEGNVHFESLYEAVAPLVQADLSYINLETVCAGEAFGYSGYPMFNGPVEILDALSNTGFNWLSLSSNHSMDAGAGGMIAQIEYMDQNLPHLVHTGAYSSQEDSEQPDVIEINGIKVGLASFTYGLNGLSKPEGYDWLVDVYADDAGNIDYSLIDRKLQQLQSASDVQIVSMHWGLEYQQPQNEVQEALAQYLHEKGVEVIIGSHPHVVQQAEILTTGDQQTLVYYSLGNFISAQDQAATMIGALASFTLHYNFDTQQTTFENAAMRPVVTWYDPALSSFRVYPLSDWNESLETSHYLYGQVPLSFQWFAEHFQQAAGAPENIQIILE